MALEIIVKANDGRGRGHVGRVVNFIDYEHFGDSLKLIVHSGFADAVPEMVTASLVEDKKWRVNLDFIKGKSVYYKDGNGNHSPGDFSVTPEIVKAITNYYFSLLDNLSPDIRLIYIDDQNSPEALFPEMIAKAIGVNSPGTLRALAPNAYVAFEIETQIWNKTGDYAMGQTRADCFERASYIHLSTDIDFLRKAIGEYNFGRHAEKIIPMGFPLSQRIRLLFDSLRSNETARSDVRAKLAGKIGTSLEGKMLCYSSFGAGAGSEHVFSTLLECVDERSDCVFVATDPRGELAGKLRELKYDVLEGKNRNVKVAKTHNGNNLYLITQTTDEHLQLLVASDILIQGNGSGTTYEGIASLTPMICIPLDRPGYEQLLKGIGIEKCGGGKVLFLERVQNQVNDLYEMVFEYGHSLKGTGATYNKRNLLASIQSMVENRAAYVENLAAMGSYFATPESMFGTLGDMALHRLPPNIIKDNGLKPLV